MMDHRFLFRIFDNENKPLIEMLKNVRVIGNIYENPELLEHLP